MFPAIRGRTQFARELWEFFHQRISLDEARSIVRRRMEEREDSFFRLVERGIFGNPKSPYLPLLKLAGCESGDIREMVRARGLEGTLLALHEAGVYIKFEEFKGRRPIVRNGHEFSVTSKDFDNPYLRNYFEISSGGTTGAPTRVRYDLLHHRDRAPQLMLALDAHGVLNVPTALWRGGLPVQTGIGNMLLSSYMGHVHEKWFAPITDKDVTRSIRRQNASIIILGRLAGVPVPWPQPVRVDQAGIIARWARDAIRRRGACLLRAHVSMAVRVSVEARDRGWDLTGATFMGGGEPPTPGKVREIRRCGARWIPTYVFSEGGFVGMGCGSPVDGSDVHFLEDGLALIQCPREVPDWGTSVLAFYFTSLLPSSPKLMLNVESDDYGVLETRSCGCPLEPYGFKQHLRSIRSFSKFTGEGVTLFGSTLVRILDEVLPSRFGGSPLDYQLAEEEDTEGFSRFYLFVSPRVAVSDERALIDTVLGTIPQEVATILRQARTLQVVRTEPVWSDRGKLHPLHLSQRKGITRDALSPTEAIRS